MADESAGDTGEGQEVDRLPLVTTMETATVGEPGRVRSIVQRWRPGFCGVSTLSRAIRGVLWRAAA